MGTLCVVIDIPTKQAELELRSQFEQLVPCRMEQESKRHLDIVNSELQRSMIDGAIGKNNDTAPVVIDIPIEPAELEKMRHFERMVCFRMDQEKKGKHAITNSAYGAFCSELQGTVTDGSIGKDNELAAVPSGSSKGSVVIDMPFEPTELEKRRHFERTVCFRGEHEKKHKSCIVLQGSTNAGPIKKDDYIAAEPSDRSKELGLPASATMEEIVLAIIEQKRLCNVMWTDSKHGANVSGKAGLSFHKVTFPMKLDYLFDEVMNMISAWGIGQRFMSQVAVIPGSYYGQPPATVDKSEAPSGKPSESFP